MRKSLIIAKCLANSGLASTPEDGERMVEQVFRQTFPQDDYAEWNRDVNDDTADRIIRRVGRTTRLQIEQFIRDLWELR